MFFKDKRREYIQIEKEKNRDKKEDWKEINKRYAHIRSRVNLSVNVGKNEKLVKFDDERETDKSMNTPSNGEEQEQDHKIVKFSNMKQRYSSMNKNKL